MTRSLLAWLTACLLAAGCAGVQPTIEVRQKPSHTCTDFRDCFGQLWIGVKMPIADSRRAATFICRDGIPVGVVVEVPRAGQLKLTWPADVCRNTEAPKAPPTV